MERKDKGRTPQGVRGLKYVVRRRKLHPHKSHPARGAWIEIIMPTVGYRRLCRRTPQGVRGLKSACALPLALVWPSHPARGAWIEIY